jgi:hypothetical protein
LLPDTPLEEEEGKEEGKEEEGERRREGWRMADFLYEEPSAEGPSEGKGADTRKEESWNALGGEHGSQETDLAISQLSDQLFKE